MVRFILRIPKSSDVKIGKLLDKFENKVKVYPPGTCPLTVQLSLLQSSKTRHAENAFHVVTDCTAGDTAEEHPGWRCHYETYEHMKKLATMIKDTADCAIGYQSRYCIFRGLETFHDEYISHIEKHECPGEMGQKVPCINMCPAHVDILWPISHWLEMKIMQAQSST